MIISCSKIHPEPYYLVGKHKDSKDCNYNDKHHRHADVGFDVEPARHRVSNARTEFSNRVLLTISRCAVICLGELRTTRNFPTICRNPTRVLRFHTHLTRVACDVVKFDQGNCVHCCHEDKRYSVLGQE